MKANSGRGYGLYSRYYGSIGACVVLYRVFG